MINKELARLELLRRSIREVLTQTVAGGKLELQHLNLLNYNTKKTRLIAFVDLYIEHLKTVRRTVVNQGDPKLILRSAEMITAETKRWEALKFKIKALDQNSIISFKNEMTKLLDELEIELKSVQSGIQEEIKTLKAA